MRSDNENAAAAFVFIGAVAASPALVVFSGFLYQNLWNWFISPLGAPNISLAHGVGLSCIIGLLKYRQANDRSDNDNAGAGITNTIVTYSFVLVIGYIAKQWM